MVVIQSSARLYADWRFPKLLLSHYQSTNCSHIFPFSRLRQGAHSECDRSAENVYSSMQPDPVSNFCRGPCFLCSCFVSPLFIEAEQCNVFCKLQRLRYLIGLLIIFSYLYMIWRAYITFCTFIYFFTNELMLSQKDRYLWSKEAYYFSKQTSLSRNLLGKWLITCLRKSLSKIATYVTFVNSCRKI